MQRFYNKENLMYKKKDLRNYTIGDFNHDLITLRLKYRDKSIGFIIEKAEEIIASLKTKFDKFKDQLIEIEFTDYASNNKFIDHASDHELVNSITNTLTKIEERIQQLDTAHFIATRKNYSISSP